MNAIDKTINDVENQHLAYGNIIHHGHLEYFEWRNYTKPIKTILFRSTK